MDDAQVIAKVKSDLTWLQKHERIICIPLLGLVLWFAIGKVDTLIADHDKAMLTQAQATALIQEHKNEALAAAAEQAAAQYQALAEKVQQQNAALEQANVALSTALAKQQKTDATLPPTELVTRWNTLVPEASVSIMNGQITVPQTGAVATVQQLEEVPVLRTQNANISTQNANIQSELGASRTQVDALTHQVDGLNLQIVDNKKVCQDQIAVVKAEARKSKRRWFVIGYVAGFVSRQAIKSYLGF